jgi:dCMP deaminase
MTDRRLLKERVMFGVAEQMARLATCSKRRVGCVITDGSGHILSTGYNGSMPGAAHCSEVGCLIVEGKCIRTTHAEANAIAHAARQGVSLDNSIMYVTANPCINCLKLLKAAGVFRVVFIPKFDDGVTRQDSPQLEYLKRQSGIEMLWPFNGVDDTGQLLNK